MRVVLLVLAICAAAPAGAVDISTYAFSSGMNCQGVWRLPDTGQSTSYTATFGEDHDYQPAAAQMSYTVLNPVGISSVTVDNVTGLMWITNPLTDAGFNKPGASTWDVATSSCEALSYAGYTDWRLPNVRELMSIVDYGVASAPRINTTAFPGTQSSYYWSSTTYALTSSAAWIVVFSSGRVSTGDKAGAGGVYARCVRGGPY